MSQAALDHHHSNRRAEPERLAPVAPKDRGGAPLQLPGGGTVLGRGRIRFDAIAAAAVPELAGRVQGAGFDAGTGRLDVVSDAPVVGTTVCRSAPKFIAAADQAVPGSNVAGTTSMGAGTTLFSCDVFAVPVHSRSVRLCHLATALAWARRTRPGFVLHAVCEDLTRRLLLRLWRMEPGRLDGEVSARGLVDGAGAVRAARRFVPGLLEGQGDQRAEAAGARA
ncbi:hypothetical protein [Streptomyces sp. NPDC047097]|uniref:hypothetical protein n=1 Tax=Streptomyces sp. NPDC047097 TaxID=3155260 RepID=UPI00340024A8